VTRAYGDADSDWAPGQVLDGDYLVEGLLGQGGMGVVVAAHHVRSGEPVAIKLIRREVTSPAFLKRFLRETSIALQLRGPHVARVLRVAHLPSGLPYLVMERLRGSTLESLLHQRGRLPVDVAVDYLLEACDAVAEAHALGVVHRDLKPGNMFLAIGATGEATLKVIDFGISKWRTQPVPDAEQRAKTTTAPIGSPSYMSPEQLEEVGVADPRTDVWALGVILCELVTGRLPFEAPSMASLQVRILCESAPSLRVFDPSLPAGLDAVYQRCVVKDRAERMPSVHDLAVALAPYASSRGRAKVATIAARGGRAVKTTEGDTGGEVVTAPPAGREPPHRRPKLVLALAGAALALGGVGFVAVWRRPQPPHPPESRPAPAPARAPSTTFVAPAVAAPAPVVAAPAPVVAPPAPEPESAGARARPPLRFSHTVARSADVRSLRLL